MHQCRTVCIMSRAQTIHYERQLLSLNLRLSSLEEGNLPLAASDYHLLTFYRLSHVSPSPVSPLQTRPQPISVGRSNERLCRRNSTSPKFRIAHIRIADTLAIADIRTASILLCQIQFAPTEPSGKITRRRICGNTKL